jgi:hypothetical protein
MHNEEFVSPKGSIEIRCPGRFRKLFLVLKRDTMPQPGMYMEIACADCAKDARRDYPNTARILHYYDTSGNCVKTKLVPGE